MFAIWLKNEARPMGGGRTILGASFLAVSSFCTLVPSLASASVVNLGSDLGFTYDGGGSDPAPTPGEHINFIGLVPTLSLAAGTYKITNATGLAGANPNFTAWSYNLGTSNWAWGFVVANTAGKVIDYEDAGDGNSQSQVARLPSVVDFASTFSLMAPTTVAFTLRDYYVADNGGGLSLNIQPLQVSAVPEMSTWCMILVGFAALGMAGYRRLDRHLPNETWHSLDAT